KNRGREAMKFEEILTAIKNCPECHFVGLGKSENNVSEIQYTVELVPCAKHLLDIDEEVVAYLNAPEPIVKPLPTTEKKTTVGTGGAYAGYCTKCGELVEENEI